MRKNRRIMLLIIIALFLVSISFLFFIYNESIKNCVQVGSYSCFDSLLEESFVPFIYTPLFLVISSIFILFFSERVFGIWKKFSYFAVPIMILWIALTKTTEFAGCGMFFCIDRTFVVFFSGTLYFILTIFITTISTIIFRARDKRLK
jgi:hypothetical protein